jgi:ribosomal-protein-alanine N-acetyltransferase
MFEYTSNENVTRYLEWKHHMNINETRSFINKTLHDYEIVENAFLWAIELVSVKKLIGVVRIYDYSPRNRRAEISYILNPAYQGNGYIGEAINSIFDFCFNTVKVSRIQAKCEINNSASEKVMNRIGMIREGILRNYFYMDGQSKDALLYAITDDMYLNNQK